MELLNNIKKNTNNTLTENGDIALTSSLNANVDFFALASALRSKYFVNFRHLTTLLDNATEENILLAIKNIFFLRDPRNGNKERRLGRFALVYIANNYPETFLKIIPELANIGRFDDLVYILNVTKNSQAKRALADYIKNTLETDLILFNKEGIRPSLLAKWLPTFDAGKKSKAYAKALIKQLNMDRIKYTRIVKHLRKGLKLVETKINNGDFANIDYEHVASQAMLKNKNLFIKKDTERFSEYIDAVKKGKKSLKTATLTPVQIIQGINNARNKDTVDHLNVTWNSLGRKLTDKNIIVVRDGSASMLGTPMDTADALSIYASECLTGVFKDKFITFSESPKLVEFPKRAKTIQDKLNYLHKYMEAAQTNIEKVYDLILRSSIGIPANEQIDTIIIVSDMQFDYAVDDEYDAVSTYENAKRKFEENGIKLPHVVFWNVDARHIQLPASKDDNVSLVSGYSTELFKEIVKGDATNPVERMINTLSRYDYLDGIIN